MVDIKFKRDTTGLPVHQTRDGNGAHISVDSEEKFQQKYPWSFKDHLLPKLQKLYSNFKQDKAFWTLKKELEKNEKFSSERYLDLNKKKRTNKKFYSPGILKEFNETLFKATNFMLISPNLFIKYTPLVPIRDWSAIAWHTFNRI